MWAGADRWTGRRTGGYTHAYRHRRRPRTTWNVAFALRVCVLCVCVSVCLGFKSLAFEYRT
jgi:hypothetical protein